MTITLSADELRPLVRAIVAETLAAAAGVASDAGRLAFMEAEAAAAIGVRPHVLRDARLRGEIVATKIGGRIGYERAELIGYLARNREDSR